MYEQARRGERAQAFPLETARAARVLSILAALGLPSMLYLRTLAPTIYNIDSAELVTAASTVGIPHPPGYPLYILLSQPFVHLPVGDVGYRVNMMSAFFAVVALFFVYMTILQITRSRIAAVAGTWALGLSYPFWADSVVAEVYTLDAALVAATLFFLVRWQSTQRAHHLVLAFAIFGLSLTNRTTNLLAAPALIYFAWPAWRSDRRALIGAVLAAVPPLALYALLPLRSLDGDAYRWGTYYALDGSATPMDLTDLSLLAWYVSSRVFSPLVFGYQWPDQFVEAGIFAADFWTAFLGGGVILSAVGVVWLCMRQRRIAVLLLLVAVPQTIFFINYTAPDKETMFLTTFVVAAICIGCGTARLISGLEVALPGRPVAAASALAVGVWALLLFQTNFALVDVSDDYRARDQSQALFEVAEPGSIIIGRWTDVAPLEYLQIVEGERRDVRVVQQWTLKHNDYRKLVQHNLEDGRKVLVFRREPALRRDFWFKPVGDWYEVRLRPSRQLVE